MLADNVVVSAGSVFAVSSRSGDIEAGTTQGFYADDTRFLSSYRLKLNGREPESTGAGTFDNSMASFYQSSVRGRSLPPGSVSLTRDRYVALGLHEDITLVNHSSKTKSVRLELSFDADFADVFEVRLGNIRKVGRVVAESTEVQQLRLVYHRDHFHRETRLDFSAEAVIRGKKATFEVVLQPKIPWKTCVTILPVGDSEPQPMSCVESVLGSPFGQYHPEERLPIGSLTQEEVRRPLDEVPRLETDHTGLLMSFNQAVADLRSLRIEYNPGHYILAAGLPWFMTVFGRDSIISSIQTKLLEPELMVGTLNALASLQADEVNQFREAEPGKIIHELRKGELSVLEEVPHSRYYGSVDATPLFLVLLWEAYQWTADLALLRNFLPSAEAALRWIDEYGDSDGDGFVEYKRRSPRGLRNQGWKDSSDSISFADGTLAEGAIALCEVQGYVYDAKCKMAEVYRVLGDLAKAGQLNQEAEGLKKRFDQAFWMPREGYYAVALDGRKRQVGSITSNPGHCLWSGIVPQEKAGMVAERLLSPDMFSGWGIRTMSTEMVRYNPGSYHNGSVWPHDNSIIAAGLAQYGFFREANQVAMALTDAAVAFPNYRLPELFAGYPRREHSFPVSYTAANSPQAWASRAVIHLLETILGVIATGDRLLQEAPREGLTASLVGVRYRGTRRVL